MAATHVWSYIMLESPLKSDKSDKDFPIIETYSVLRPHSAAYICNTGYGSAIAGVHPSALRQTKTTGEE